MDATLNPAPDASTKITQRVRAVCVFTVDSSITGCAAILTFSGWRGSERGGKTVIRQTYEETLEW